MAQAEGDREGVMLETLYATLFNGMATQVCPWSTVLYSKYKLKLSYHPT